ncbi:MAG TPA: S41 family peptidase [Fimbriimonas sp.]|nr:S41 family peptidase [Fimbriimonas sp.]
MKLIKPAVGALALCSTFALGYYLDDIRYFQGSPRDLLLGIKTSKKEESAEAVFKQSFAKILGGYTKATDRQELTYAAMEGLVASLGDPHSNFFVPKVNSEFRDLTQGKFFGVGARLMPDPLGVKVVSVFRDGPAEKAGIKAQDIVVAVDGKDVAGMASDDIVLLIKGEEGTTVRIKVLRPGAQAPIEFAIKRGQVVPPNVESKYVAAEQIGYIKILSFAVEVPEQFEYELKAVESNPLKGLIIDLRDNPGGALDAAGSILSHWVDGETVVTLKDRFGGQEITKSDSGRLHKFNYPVVILVNGDSASASEIMAGVLKDYKKATIVGERTYGKFSVQTVYQQRDGAGVKLTIAHYFLPKSGSFPRKVDEDGTFISGGIEPDVKVELDQDVEFESGTMDKDAQFAKAVEVIKSKQ